LPFIYVKEGILVKVNVQPKAKKDEIIGIKGKRLKIKVRAKPERGQANKACIALLAKTFQVNEKNIILISGKTSHQKIFKIIGIDIKNIKEKIKSIV